MSDPQQLLIDIREAREALEKGADRIYGLIMAFEGDRDKASGEWAAGPKWRYQDKVFLASQDIRKNYELKAHTEKVRVPAAEVIELEAEQRVKRQDPGLWAEYHRLAAEIEAMKRWLSAKKEAVSALQSELSTERTLAR